MRSIYRLMTKYHPGLQPLGKQLKRLSSMLNNYLHQEPLPLTNVSSQPMHAGELYSQHEYDPQRGSREPEPAYRHQANEARQERLRSISSHRAELVGLHGRDMWLQRQLGIPNKPEHDTVHPAEAMEARLAGPGQRVAPDAVHHHVARPTGAEDAPLYPSDSAVRAEIELALADVTGKPYEPDMTRFQNLAPMDTYAAEQFPDSAELLSAQPPEHGGDVLDGLASPALQVESPLEHVVDRAYPDYGPEVSHQDPLVTMDPLMMPPGPDPIGQLPDPMMMEDPMMGRM